VQSLAGKAISKKVIKAALFFLIGFIAIYLLLVLAGGGWSPRLDDTFAWDGNSVLLFAHRGVRDHVPENCGAAFSEAVQLGFKAIELDIRRTKDDQLAILHDPAPKRMLGVDTPLNDLSLAEIKKHKMLFKGQETTNYIPTLREVFEAQGKSLLFYLDMKEKSFRDADRIAALIAEFDLYDRCILASVDPLFIGYVEQHYPRINTALERFDAAQVWLYQLTPRRWKPDYLSGSADKVDSNHAEWLRKHHLISKRIVYGADEGHYQRILDLGIRKAIVDYDPKLHFKVLSESASN